MDQKKLRLVYFIGFMLFLAVEFIIGIYVHDQFVRPYVGDMLIVIVLYCFVRCFVPKRYPLLPLGLFIFAALVECSQAFQLTEKISILDHSLFRIILGATFDLKDIACYAVGCCLLGLFEYLKKVFSSLRSYKNV